MARDMRALGLRAAAHLARGCIGAFLGLRCVNTAAHRPPARINNGYCKMSRALLLTRWNSIRRESLATQARGEGVYAAKGGAVG